MYRSYGCYTYIPPAENRKPLVHRRRGRGADGGRGNVDMGYDICEHLEHLELFQSFTGTEGQSQ